MTRRYDRFPPLADQEPDERPATWGELALATYIGAALAVLTTAFLAMGLFIALQIIGLFSALFF